MVDNIDALLTNDLTAQIVSMNAQVQENSNCFMTLENENAILHVQNQTLQEQVQLLSVLSLHPSSLMSPDYEFQLI